MNNRSELTAGGLHQFSWDYITDCRDPVGEGLFG